MALFRITKRFVSLFSLKKIPGTERWEALDPYPSKVRVERKDPLLRLCARYTSLSGSTVAHVYLFGDVYISLWEDEVEPYPDPTFP